MSTKEDSAWYAMAVATLMLIEEKVTKEELKRQLNKVIDEMYKEFK